MSITITQSSNNPNMSYAPKEQHPQRHFAHEQKQKEKHLKIASGVCASLGVFTALSIIAKRHGIPFLSKNKIPNLLKPKTWKENHIEFKPMEIIGLAGGSVAGGLIAGIAIDPEHKKAKIREALQQMVGNIMIPIACVTAGSLLYEKYKKHLQLPKIKSSSKIAKAANVVLKALPPATATLGSLGIGILGGNWAANMMSKKALQAKEERKIKISDFAGHVDDICLATMLVAPKNNIGKIAAKIIPFALIVPGYETGIKQ
ncbi:MAG: hypothetical protein PHE78_06580 [Candidatus Gastranaerophilales bacterium]|nr:hypothetical protein [Candidatus Gastranaerophilales bacterium]